MGRQHNLERWCVTGFIMTKSVVIVLALLGISSFLFNIYWLNPEIQSLLNQKDNLITLGLFEEANNYKNEAKILSNWKFTISILGFIFVIPFIAYLLIFRIKKPNNLSWHSKNTFHKYTVQTSPPLPFFTPVPQCQVRGLTIGQTSGQTWGQTFLT